jgi:hypothetical protein
MRFTLVAVVFLASCLPAIAQQVPHGVAAQGSISVLRGIAHVKEGAEGTYIELERPGVTRSITGFIPFGNKSSFNELVGVDGSNVILAGVVVLDGGAEIVMTDPSQLVIVN